MKKLFVILAVLICAASLFAAESSISAKVSPLAIQIATSSEADEPVVSKYGVGAEVAYKYSLCCGAYAEGGLSWNTYMLPEDRPNLTSLMFFGGIGYDYKATDVLKLSAHVDLGGDTLIYDKTGSETITLKTGAGLALCLAENAEVTLGCDGLFGFAKSETASYVNYRIVPVMGVNYKF